MKDIAIKLQNNTDKKFTFNLKVLFLINGIASLTIIGVILFISALLSINALMQGSDVDTINTFFLNLYGYMFNSAMQYPFLVLFGFMSIIYALSNPIKE